MGIPYQEIDFYKVKDFERTKEEMIRKSGGAATVPQIFVGGKHIGGNSDFQDLIKSGGWEKIYS